MGALPRPDLPPGPHADLNAGLHELHHEAGWPSLRRLAAAAGCSHTTISKALSSAVLPSWGIVEVLVEAMGGDVGQFRALWLAATTPDPAPAPASSRIIGRRAELAAVRRHLEAGTGLLLVTGEAGIGKSKLVQVAAGSADCFVTTGHCLPLSTEVPLMPVTEVLRTTLEVEDGRWFKEVVASCPSYVTDTLARLMPELASPEAATGSFDAFAHDHLLSAIARAFGEVHALSGCGFVLEDLHWADPATLDLLEYLLAGRITYPIVGTWRSAEPETGPEHLSWRARQQRLATTTEMTLGPLSLEETSEQISVLTGTWTDATRAGLVFGRSRGNPFYTEQLALHSPTGSHLPSVLGGVLDGRLSRLTPDAAEVTAVLGLADRGLDASVLREASGLDQTGLVRALQELSRRHLLRASDDEHAELRHALLAEAARRRLVPGEAAARHRAIARALADRAGSNPAEVAEHWRGAGDQDEELPWRIRAARIAEQCSAPQEASGHWLRALDLWPPGGATYLGLTRGSAQLAAVNALDGAGRDPAALRLALAALASDEELARGDRFELAARAAGITWGQVGPEAALTRLDDAMTAHGDGMEPGRLIRSLCLRASLLSKSGHNDEALAVLEEALAMRDRVTDPDLVARLLGTTGWHRAFAGDLDSALTCFAEAWRVWDAEPTPERAAFIAMMHTDALLYHARPAAQVLAAGLTALEQIVERDLRSTMANMVRTNVAEAWLNAGQPSRAAELLHDDVLTSDAYSLWSQRLVAARVAVARGRLREVEPLTTQAFQEDSFARLSMILPRCEALLWTGDSDTARALLTELLDGGLDGDTPVIAGPAFVLLARATADSCTDPSPDAAAHLEALRSRAPVDPLGPGAAVPAWRPACTCQWNAELARGAAHDTARTWARATAEWDHLERPHDAAYCRWRGAQAALRDGQGTVADRLLRRAARDAREHVPLARAIASTRG